MDEKRGRINLVVLADCWRWVAGHCGRNPAKIGSNTGVHTGIIGISAATAEGGDTHLNSVDENRTSTVTLYKRIKISQVSSLIH